MGDYRPLRITAHMGAPIVMLPHESLPLDGVLEWAASKSRAEVVQRDLLPRDKRGRRRLPPITQQAFNFKIPVKRIGHKDDPDWHWAASWAQFPDGFETDKAHWNKRADFGDPALSSHLTFGGKSEKVNLSSGRYKSYHVPLSLVCADRVEWYVLGDHERIARLLRKITHLGKKRAYGFGETLKWSIHATDRDRSCWSDDGRPMRALPNREGNYRRLNHGIRAPYWHHQTKRLVIVPDVRERKPTREAARPRRPA